MIRRPLKAASALTAAAPRPRSARGGTPADRALARRFLELLGAMKRYVREQLPPPGEEGMSEERFRTFLTLRFYGKGYLKTLAAHDGLSSSALCIMLNRLVEEGFAARAEDPENRRNVFYELTSSGTARLQAELERRTDLIHGNLARLGEAEKARFAGAIETVLSGVEKLKGSK